MALSPCGRPPRRPSRQSSPPTQRPVILGPDEPCEPILLWARLWIAGVSFRIRSYSPFVLIVKPVVPVPLLRLYALFQVAVLEREDAVHVAGEVEVVGGHHGGDTGAPGERLEVLEH